MSQRKEFVNLASQSHANISRLCARFGISRKTGYKWMSRARQGAPDWAKDRSRRPVRSPGQTTSRVRQSIVAVRREHPVWGGRKIRKWLVDHGHTSLPTASTITAILRREDLIAPEESKRHGPLRRFEYPRPNDLWQMDFKGHFPTNRGDACHPLTILDDHSRYALGVAACCDETAETVQRVLRNVFRLYGLPVRMLMDNGACWGRTSTVYTVLEAWLIRLGISVTHGRPFHPQTQGKAERFHRTLKDEAIKGCHYLDLEDSQQGFDRFRHVYNHERPHEALGLATPASRYQISPFPYPETLPPIEYLSGDRVRRVGAAGYLSYHKGRYQVGRAFSGQLVALRATECEGIWAVYYCHHQIAVINESEKTCLQYKSLRNSSPKPNDLI